jgi:hypothetical protein
MGFKNFPAMKIEMVALCNVAPCLLVLCSSVLKKRAEDAGSRFFENSGTHVPHCVTSFS